MDSVLDTLRQDLSETDRALARELSPHVRLCLETRRNELAALIARQDSKKTQAAPEPKPHT